MSLLWSLYEAFLVEVPRNSLQLAAVFVVNNLSSDAAKNTHLNSMRFDKLSSSDILFLLQEIYFCLIWFR